MSKCRCLHYQGCGLQKIMRSPKFPNHEILGAQHLSPMVKDSRLWHPGVSRTQLCITVISDYVTSLN